MPNSLNDIEKSVGSTNYLVRRMAAGDLKMPRFIVVRNKKDIEKETGGHAEEKTAWHNYSLSAAYEKVTQLTKETYVLQFVCAYSNEPVKIEMRDHVGYEFKKDSKFFKEVVPYLKAAVKVMKVLCVVAKIAGIPLNFDVFDGIFQGASETVQAHIEAIGIDEDDVGDAVQGAKDQVEEKFGEAVEAIEGAGDDAELQFQHMQKQTREGKKGRLYWDYSPVQVRRDPDSKEWIAAVLEGKSPAAEKYNRALARALELEKKIQKASDPEEQEKFRREKEEAEREKDDLLGGSGDDADGDVGSGGGGGDDGDGALLYTVRYAKPLELRSELVDGGRLVVADGGGAALLSIKKGSTVDVKVHNKKGKAVKAKGTITAIKEENLKRPKYKVSRKDGKGHLFVEETCLQSRDGKKQPEFEKGSKVRAMVDEVEYDGIILEVIREQPRYEVEYAAGDANYIHVETVGWKNIKPAKAGAFESQLKQGSSKMQTLTGKSFRVIKALMDEHDKDLKFLPMDLAESKDGVWEWVHNDHIKNWQKCTAKTPWKATRWPHVYGEGHDDEIEDNGHAPSDMEGAAQNSDELREDRPPVGGGSGAEESHEGSGKGKTVATCSSTCVVM